MLKFTEISDISKRELITLTDSQLRNVEIRAFWAGLNCSGKKYDEKILMISEIYNIAPDTVKNIVPKITISFDKKDSKMKRGCKLFRGNSWKTIIN